MTKLTKDTFLLVNFRPIFLCFILAIIGTIVGFLAYSNVSLCISLVVSVIIVFVVICVFMPKIRLKTALMISIISFIVFFLLGVITIHCYYKNNFSGTQTITAIATDKMYEGTGNTSVILRDLVGENGKKISGKMMLYIYSEEEQSDVNLEPGSKLTFTTKLSISDFTITYKLPKASGLTMDGIKYHANVTADKVYIEAGSPNFFEIIRIKAKENIFSGFNNKELAALCYSVLFADDKLIDTELREILTLAGVAHIIAVSGLNVGFLLAFLLFVLKFFKNLSRKHKFIICTSVIGLYVAVCGFSPTIVRSFIMLEIFMLAELFGCKKDNLNSLSIAGIVILALSPASVFSLSFIYSFCCMFCLICLGKPIDRMLSKLKFVRKETRGILSGSIAINLGLICLSALTFENVILISIIANLFLIPLFSILFSIGFVLTCLSLILPFFNFLFWIVSQGFYVFISISKIFARVPVIEVHSSVVMVIMSLIVVFTISTFLMCSKNIKSRITSGLLTVLCVGLIISSMPTIPKQNQIIKLEAGGNIVTTKSGLSLIVLEEFDAVDLNKVLTISKTKKLSVEGVMLCDDISAEFLKYVYENDKIKFFAFSDEIYFEYNRKMLQNLTLLKLNTMINFYEIRVQGYSSSTGTVPFAVKFRFSDFAASFIPRLNASEVKLLNKSDALNVDVVCFKRILSEMKNIEYDKDIALISKLGFYEGENINSLVKVGELVFN